tara:strand:- start:11840 stop:12175 length:336 start_codon:yes stop_codon:yes gene_type:complete
VRREMRVKRDLKCARDYFWFSGGDLSDSAKAIGGTYFLLYGGLYGASRIWPGILVEGVDASGPLIWGLIGLGTYGLGVGGSYISGRREIRRELEYTRRRKLERSIWRRLEV